MGAQDYDFIEPGWQVHIREQLFSHLSQYHVPDILSNELHTTYKEDVIIPSNGLFMTDRNSGARGFSKSTE
ncbi:hypothetical protein [Methanolobus sp.]|uniref:hypothetical protein n=1 Tax=Methanolobus sp. TaxID=1874737 RepID=UPI0025DEBA8B|nr:hypothetical protein [Methanolobus sp.]